MTRIFAIIILFLLVAGPIYADQYVVQVTASRNDANLRNDNGTWVFSYLNPTCPVGNGSSNAYMKQGTSFRFEDIPVPPGSTIDSATIEFVAYQDQTGTSVKSRFTGYKASDAAIIEDLEDFQARRGTVIGGENNNNLTSASVTWDDIGSWIQGQEYTSPDLKTIVQEIIGVSGWASGNDILIFWDDYEGRTSGYQVMRNGYSYDGSTSLCPILTLTFTEPEEPEEPEQPGGSNTYILKTLYVNDWTGEYTTNFLDYQKASQVEVFGQSVFISKKDFILVSSFFWAMLGGIILFVLFKAVL
jgi:hypothetical protein